MTLIDLVKELPRHPTKRYALRSSKFLRGIVIHHSAGRGTPQQVARYHVEKLGWPGIGYHYMIGSGGTIYKVNNVSTLSYHCAGSNKVSIGVCLIGNFEIEEPTKEQLTALHELVTILRNSTQNKLWVKGHRELTATDCPGHHLFAKLPVLFSV